MSERLYLRGRVWWTWYYARGGVLVRASTRSRDKRAAAIIACDLERRAVDPTYRAANETTLASGADRFLIELQARGRAAGTLSMYRVKLGHLLRILGDGTPLAQVDARAVDRFTAARLEEGAGRNTISKELTALRGLLKVALRRGEFQGNVAAVLPLMWSPGYKPRSRFLEHTEAAALLGKLPEARAAHVAFIIATGARWSESVSARAEDVDLAAGTVRLRGTKTEASARVVPIVAFGRALVARVLELGRPPFLRWGNVRRDLAQVCKALGILPVTPNDLRRTAATWLRQLGSEPHLIGAFLGHTDSRMVERVYGRMPVDSLGTALRARCESIVQAPGTPTATHETPRPSSTSANPPTFH